MVVSVLVVMIVIAVVVTVNVPGIDGLQIACLPPGEGLFNGPLGPAEHFDAGVLQT
ncbi:MAG: hypothetical protein ACQEQJ_06135 [Halobacteriota archaeon]